MTTILQFTPRAVPPPAPETKAFSFEIYQAHASGLVSIDACVPMAVAKGMLDMLKAA